MKKFIVPLILIFLGGVSIIAFNIIGSSVSETGELIEPFFLIPIGSLFIFIGFVWALISGIVFVIKHLKQIKKG